MTFVIVGATPAPAVSMGVNKNGPQSVPVSNDFKLVGWTARGEYPGTVLVDDELVAGGAATVTVRCGVELVQNMSAGQSVQVMLMVNNATIQNGTIGAFNKSVKLADKVVSLAAGDRVSVHMKNGGGFAGPNINGGANTYVYFDVG